jgi:hypothetical protein
VGVGSKQPTQANGRRTFVGGARDDVHHGAALRVRRLVRGSERYGVEQHERHAAHPHHAVGGAQRLLEAPHTLRPLPCVLLMRMEVAHVVISHLHDARCGCDPFVLCAHVEKNTPSPDGSTKTPRWL